jgi:hypothetical protein
VSTHGGNGPRRASPGGRHRPQVFLLKVNGEVEFRAAGERRADLLHYALGIAAQLAFEHARPVLIKENGIPFRYVDVYRPDENIDIDAI